MDMRTDLWKYNPWWYHRADPFKLLTTEFCWSEYLHSRNSSFNVPHPHWGHFLSLWYSLRLVWKILTALKFPHVLRALFLRYHITLSLHTPSCITPKILLRYTGLPKALTLRYHTLRHFLTKYYLALLPVCCFIAYCSSDNHHSLRLVCLALSLEQHAHNPREGTTI